MKYTNAFFQLDIRDDGVYVHIYPAKENGKSIDIQEMVSYLESCGIHSYDLPALNKAVMQVKEETDIFVSAEKIREVEEKAKVMISRDRMMAYIRFYPPSKNGKYMSPRDILNELQRVNVVYGISEKVISAYIAGRQFCRDIPIAKGKECVLGKDAKIKYHFNTVPTTRPELLEDGSVDFHKLCLFTSIKNGDLLAELIPEVPGTEGKNVLGNPVIPPKVKKKVLKYGRNIKISEDNCKLYSEVDGDVKLEGDTVFVSNTYTVAADVDASTGDIKYNGNVVVTGNVRAGFRIEATGDIEVNGVVEGAYLKADGNIVLKRGIQGMGRGELEAGINIVTKFIESSKVSASGVINAGSSLHSELIAGEEVIISGKKGFVIGGTVSAGKKIEASVFGNKMNTPTVLKVGVKPEVMERFKDLTTIIKDEQEEMIKQKQILDSLKNKLASGQKLLPNQVILAKQSSEKLKTLAETLEKDSFEYMKLKKEIEDNTNGKIVVNNTIFPGVSIDISNRMLLIKDIRSRCQFKIDGADVIGAPV
ncbi:MAG: FapA family protein [Eubacteriales bacterium]|nr:FapA family protein [Eubacteriales bacterium]